MRRATGVQRSPFDVGTRLLRAVFPAPRRAVRWWQAWPVVVAVAGLALAVLALETTRTVTFAAPGAFALAVVLPWVWWMQAAGWGGQGGWRHATALAVRFALLLTVIAALAEPRAVRSSDALSLVYCVDTSDSIGDRVVDQARNWMLTTVGQKPPKDDAGLVAFGRDAAVELPPRQSFPFERFATRIARDGTDLEQALSLSAAVIPEDRPGRIVLISDGVATRGAVDRVLDQLTRRGIAVDVLPVQYDHRNEVWVERVDLPAEVRIGESYEAAVLLGALQDGRGELVLRENGREVARGPVAWRAGKSRFALPLRLRGPGYYEYTATIEPAAGLDGWSENNTALAWLYLQGEGRVLVLVAGDGRAEDHTALVKALVQGERAVEVKTATECPDDPLSLLPYDAVILVNVPADEMDQTQQVALRTAVADQGMGLIMVGGRNGFGPGGWNRTPVEEALPVTMDISARKVMPKGALVIVLHTCEFGDGNTWAKRITKQAIKVLGAKDEAGVVDFDYQGSYKWVFPLTPAGEYEKLVPLIEAANPSDMPDFNATFQLAFDGLAASDAATKHIIVISDGDPSPPAPQLLARIVKAKITVSTITIEPHNNQEIAAYRMIAEATGGRSYYPKDPARLPAIFVKEAKTLKRSQIQNLTFTPGAGFPSPIMKGIAAVPPLRGYTLTTPKPRAQTVLEGPDPDEEDPVLAWWRFGTGASAAFTADLGTNWGADWVAWDRYQAFVTQLVTSVARLRTPSRLRLTASTVGGEGVITVIDHHPGGGFLDLSARVTLPDGAHRTVPLAQTGPGRYRAAVPLAGRGRYQVLVAGGGSDGAGAARQERASGGFAVAYSQEYLRFRSDPQGLERIAARTGGRVLNGNEDGAALYGVPREPRSSSRPVFAILLWLLAALLVLDVAVRRVQPDWSVIAGWFRRGKAEGPSTPVMGALMAAKTRAQERTAAESAAQGLPAPRAASVPRPVVPVVKPAPSAPPAAAPPSASSTAPSSTMDRLLAAKRRRQDPPT